MSKQTEQDITNLQTDVRRCFGEIDSMRGLTVGPVRSLRETVDRLIKRVETLEEQVECLQNTLNQAKEEPRGAGSKRTVSARTQRPRRTPTDSV